MKDSSTHFDGTHTGSMLDEPYSDTISRNTRDDLTQTLLAGSVTGESGLCSFFAADLLIGIRRSAGEHLRHPIHQLAALHEECGA